MNRLLLLRHAKSSWDDPSLADHERPLAPRGHRAAESMAEHLRSNVPHPDLVLCSSALRTRETLERMSKAFGDAEVVVDDDLYGATDELLLERLRGVADRFETVAMIGHNPGVHDLAIALAGSGADLAGCGRSSRPARWPCSRSTGRGGSSRRATAGSRRS